MARPHGIPAVMTVGEVLPGHLDALDAQARIDRELVDLDQAICELEHQTQICSLHNRMCLLRTQRNSLSPVSLLPPEVLEVVFIHWARIHHNYRIENIDGVTCTVHETEIETTTDEAESMTEGTESLSDGVEEKMDGAPVWVNASHVCSYWRGVALNCPALWSYISPASQRWIQEMLSRSKTAPLKIQFEWTVMDSNALDVLMDLLAHTERIQELRLDVPRHDVKKVVPMLSSPAPLLQSLEIHLLSSHQPYEYYEHYAIQFFGGVTPALHRLELDRYFEPRAPAIGTLTTLILSYLDPPNKPTPSQLHVLLSSMPNLVHLGLRRALAPSRDELGTRATCDSQNTQLPHLLRLSIHEPLLKVTRFLACLDIPSQTEVRIDACSQYPEDWRKFRTFLLPRLFTSRCCLPCSIAVELQDGMTSIVFCGSENAHHYLYSYSPDWDCNIPLKVRLSRRMCDQWNTIRDIIQGADGSGFLAGLQSTSVTLRGNADEDRNLCSNFLEDLFGLLPKLRYIDMTSASTRLGCLFSSLSLTPHRRDEHTTIGQPSGEKHTPALEKLVIRGSKFKADWESLRDRCPGGVMDLYKALAIRKEKGFTPIRLALIECRNVFKDDVVKLEDVAAEVTWDGIEEEGSRGGSDSDSDSDSEGSSYEYVSESEHSSVDDSNF